MKLLYVGALALLSALTTPGFAQRSSANYFLLTESATSSTSTLSTSADYAAEASLGADGGIAANVANAQVTRAGFVGQLVDVASLALNVADVPEAGTSQASIDGANTDGTTSTFAPALFTWSIPAGPAVVSAGGLVSGLPVYQDTAAAVRAQFGALTLNRTLTVRNVLPDNFGIYAADGIEDGWQVQYFGVGNALAGPTIDADGDGQSNVAEYLGGFVPTNPNSALRLVVETVTPAAVTLRANQIVPGASYQLQTTTNFVTWNNLGSPFWFLSPQSNVAVPGGTMSGTARFYRLQLSPRP